MKQFLITVAGVLVGLVLFIFIMPVVLISWISSATDSRHAESAPQAIVLDLDLRTELTDAPAQTSFFGSAPSVVDTVLALKAAAADDRVKGVFIRSNTWGMYPAHAQEISNALRQFQSAKKWVVASVQDDGVTMSLSGLSTVASADEIWLHGSGVLSPIGVTAEQTFFGGTMRKFHVTPQFEKREEFKTGPNMFTETGFTAADRESTTGLLNAIYSQGLTMLADGRRAKGLTPEGARSAIEATPMSAQQAIDSLLVDKLGTPEDAMDSAIQRAGGDKKAGLVPIAQYVRRPDSGPVIALVPGEGTIMTGPPQFSPFGGEAVMSSDAVSNALLEASMDKDVKAIIFRVSSPGGSAVASDQIWKAVETAQSRGKKVVVSMGALAASGGYYVSAGADEIVASPGTLTGSIGVYSGKFVLGDAMEHYLAANTEEISVGSPVANYFSAARPFSNAERDANSAMVQAIYDRFVGIVAEGRGLTRDEALAAAKGRVWTGAEAANLKLVNTIGGLDVAIDRAKALSGIAAEDNVSIRYFPRPLTKFESIQAMFDVSAENARAAAALGAILGDERVAAMLEEAMQDRRGVRAETSVEVR